MWQLAPFIFLLFKSYGHFTGMVTTKIVEEI